MKRRLIKQFPKYFLTPMLGLKEVVIKGVLRQDKRGFTLVEVIGVLAIIAILAALISPQIVNQIGKGNVVALAQSIPIYRKAIENYYRDIGSLRPLNVTGVPALEATGNSAVPTSLPARLMLDITDPLNTGANQWLRFRGPYLEQFSSANPPALGNQMFMPAATAVSYGTGATTTNLGWDLDTTDGLSDIPTGNTVVYLRITGIQQRDFLHLNNILDGGTSLAKSHSPQIDTTQPPALASLVAGGGGGPPPSNTTTRGRVKYNTGTQTVLIYLAHSP